MCWPQLVAAMATAAPAAATATAVGATTAATVGLSPAAATTAAAGLAGTAAGLSAGAAASTAAGVSAQAALATQMASAAFVTNTVSALMSYSETAKAAAATGKAAIKDYQREQKELAERERQEELSFQVENDQLSRNAAIGIAKTKTLGTAQGVGPMDDRVADFMIKSEEMMGLERANLKLVKSSIRDNAEQSRLRAKVVVDQARSATGGMALAGLALNIYSGWIDATRMFGSKPFEDPEEYAARINPTLTEGQGAQDASAAAPISESYYAEGPTPSEVSPSPTVSPKLLKAPKSQLGLEARTLRQRGKTTTLMGRPLSEEAWRDDWEFIQQQRAYIV